MRIIVAGLLIVLPFVVSPVHAASLTLGCSGTVTTTQIPKDAIASEPETSPWSDLSVVVNLDQKTVSGFWYSGHDVPGHDALPIIAADANSVSFRGRKGNPGVQISIEGIIDRITGKIEATETWLSKVGNLTTMEYDLRCKPTRPLF